MYARMYILALNLFFEKRERKRGREKTGCRGRVKHFAGITDESISAN